MTTNVYIKYKSGYKYQLYENYEMDIIHTPQKEIHTRFICLNTNGHLKIKGGYAWDGTSGPVIDTDNNMRASLVHDALYQLIRMQLLPSSWKDIADKIFYKMCKQDGVLGFIANIYYRVLKKFGWKAVLPRYAKEVKFAPTR